MFNNTSNTSITKTSVNFNSPATGILQRSHPKSRFKRIFSGSKDEENYFGIEPKEWKTDELERKRYYGDKSPILILQTLLLNNGYLIEYIFEDDIED
jgi:hypothetical protein